MRGSDESALPANKAVIGWGWVFVAISFAWTLIGIPFTGLPIAVPSFFVALPMALLHGVRRYGGLGTAVFWIATLVISNLLENSSIIMGFPFGHYHYTLGPKLFHVPLVVGPFYVAIGYLSWQTANALLDKADLRLAQGKGVILLPVVAAAVMTMFDLVTDPIASTIGHTWVWHGGGEYFGVPYTNFLGWLLVTYLFFQVFALFLRFSGRPPREEASRQPLLQVILLYFNLGLTVPVAFLIVNSASYTDTAGRVWTSQEIFGALSTVFIFTVAFVTVLALVRLRRLDAKGPPQT